MIIGKAYEVLSNPKSRAEHDFMIDYQNVVNITNEINSININDDYQKQNVNRTDKKYYRTNAGYTPPIEKPLNYTDKPKWTSAGTIIAYFGILLFVFVIFANIETTPIESEYLIYKSRTGKIRTTQNYFFGILSESTLANIYQLQNEKKIVTIVAHKSKFANFIASANIKPINEYVFTIGFFSLIFATASAIFSFATLYVKKHRYYFFIELTSINLITMFFILLMII